MAGANPLGIIEGLLEVENKIGEFIKGDIGGDSAVAEHFRDQYRARCEEFSNAPDWLQGFVGLGAGGAISRICKPYLDDNQWDPPETGLPFTGGQCAGVSYRVRFNYILTNGNPGISEVIRTGPITRLQIVDTFCTSLSGFPVSCSASDVNNQTWVWEVDSASGTTQRSTSGQPGGSTSFTVVRQDGQPDTCGDPDPVPVPGPNPAPLPDPIRLPGDEPRPNPRNRDGLPDIPVDPFPDPFGGPGFPALPDGFGFGGGKSGGGGAGRSFDPIENDDETGGQDEDFDDPPEGEVWVGAYLELTQVPGNITTVPGTGPENGAYFRIVGNFSIYSDSESSRLYSDSVQVRNKWTKFIGNPQGLPVTGARVSVLPGVRYRVIPVSAPADPDRNGEE